MLGRLGSGLVRMGVLAFACWIALAGVAAAERRLALVIGNGAYENVLALPNPVNDADAMAAALDRLGFEVVRATDVDHRGFVSAVREFSERLVGADMALFFYAGHGLQVNGNNYLIPVDAEIDHEADLDFTAIDADFVLRQMERHAAVKVVLLDACRNNPFNQRLARSMGATRAVSALGAGLAPMEAAGGALIGFATDPGALAFDGEGRHSPFTAALLEHIETPGLEINVMMTRVRAEVYASTNRLQRPWATTSLIGEVYLAPEVEEAPVAAVAAVDERQLDFAFWNAVKDSDNPAELSAYLQRFPEGVFAPLATSRLSALTAPADDSVSEPDPAAMPVAEAEETAETAAAPLAAAQEAVEPSGEELLASLTETEPTTRIPTPRPVIEQAAVDEAAQTAAESLQRQTDPFAIAGLTPIEPQPACPSCPAMVALPGGAFTMGSPPGEGGAEERPQTPVTLAPFDIAARELTIGQFRAFVTATGKAPAKGCFTWTESGKLRRSTSASWEAPGYPVTDDSPAACLTSADAEAYATWVSGLTGQTYRLPSEAEFEYAARAGTESAWFFGASAADACRAVNGAGAEARFRWRNRACDDGIATVAAAGSLPSNAYGLYEIIGNLWEWTADCWNGSHRGAAADGSARRRGQCASRVVRGGSWDDPVENLRSAYRVGIPADRRQGNVGFRLVRERP